MINHILSFIHEATYDDLPPAVRDMAQLCLLDLIGSLCGGRLTRLSEIIRHHAADVYGGDQASLLLDGRRCSAPGAALANGMTIDALDIHDSHKASLGHAGVHVFPTVLAVAQQLQAAGKPLISGPEFLTALVVGYDIGCRAGAMLHATTCDYHTSGAWGAVSSAALYSRLHGLQTEKTRHALGIAEYHGPRSQMMRCIDHPTMLKDGSGWGAMAGLSAGMLAAQGFTGAPAVTLEADEVADGWRDLGTRWEILEQGFKVHGVCWWAQPAIAATLAVASQHDLDPADIDQIEIRTFEKATRLNHPRPSSTEEAQYSLPYPVAAALRRWADGRTNGRTIGFDEAWTGLGPAELLEGALADERTLALAERVSLVPQPELTARFPEEMLARAIVTLTDGSRYESEVTTFRGGQENPLSAAELRDKYRRLAQPTLHTERAAALEETVFTLPDAADIRPLLDQLSPPPENERPL